MQANTADSGIRVEKLTQTYGKKQILKDVSFSADQGSCVGIVGINGGGKSTLLDILAGIRRPRSGSYRLFGRNMLEDRSSFGKWIGYLPQGNPLLEDLSVYDNLRLWYGHKVTSDLPVLHKLQLLELLPLKVRELSGGMKRRLSIACAVAENQPVLILDEPSSSLDLHQKKIIRDFISDYIGEGGIVLLSTHDMQEIRLCTDLYYLEDGVTVPLTADEALDRLQEGVQ